MKEFWKNSKRVLAVSMAAVLLLALIPLMAVSAASVTDHTAAVGPNLPTGKTNLVTNGDFSNGTTGWSLNNDAGSASIADGVAKLTVSGSTGIDQTVTVEAGKTYVISFYTWVTTATNMKTGIQLNGSGFNWSMQSSNGYTSVTNGWVENTYTITPTESGSLWFRIRCAWGGTGEFYVDDVCIYDPNEVAAVTGPSDHTASVGPNLPTGKTNLVTNGDFSNGTTGWSLNNSNGSASIADGMAKLTVSGETGIDQTIQVEANTTYTISFYTWVTDATNIKTGFQYNGGGLGWGMLSSNGYNAVTDGWVENTYTITPTESGSLWFRIRCAWGGTGEFYVDDLCVYNPNEAALVPTDHGGNTELPEGATELISGGDFSNATPSGWSNNFGTGDGIADGMLKFSKDATTTYRAVAPGVTAQPGKTYVLSYYYWVDNAADGGAYTRVRVLSGGGTTNDKSVFTGNDTYDILSDDTDGWVRVEKTFTVPSDLDTTAYPQMRVWLYNSLAVGFPSAVGDVYYDDISLYCVDDIGAEEETVVYTEIKAEDVSVFYAVDQSSMNRSTFALQVSGVTFPTDDWDTYKTEDGTGTYFTANIDGKADSVQFGKINQAQDNGTFYREGALLVYVGITESAGETYAVANAETLTIPAGTKFLDPDNALVGWHFVEDVTVRKSLAADAGWKQETAFIGSQLTLGDTLKSDVTLKIPATDFVAGLKVKASVTKSGTTVDEYIDLPDTAATTGSYTVQLSTAAKNMSDVYTLSLVTADDAAVGATQTYSIKEYAEKVMAGATAGDTTYNAAKSLLNYGAYAQVYFGYNTENLANAGDGVAISASELTEKAGTYVQAATDVAVSGTAADFLGYTLVLKDTTTIRLNFSSAVEGATAGANGRYYIEITGIGAKDLGTVYTIPANDSIYSVSALGLAKKVITDSADNTNFVNLMYALAQYYADAIALV